MLILIGISLLILLIAARLLRKGHRVRRRKTPVRVSGKKRRSRYQHYKVTPEQRYGRTRMISRKGRRAPLLACPHPECRSPVALCIHRTLKAERATGMLDPPEKR
jgi:hypothetical protein